MPLKLWFARVLRLTGTTLVAGFFVAFLIAYLSGENDPSGPFWLISVIVGISCLALGIPLALIGDKVSPPDPWLDPWLNPFRGRKRVCANPYKEDDEEPPE